MEKPMDEMLILVNANDELIGHGTKLHVHQKGMMHRAFSILVFDSGNRLLLQKRASRKYHSAGLWSNSCCGHPRQDEDTDAAAHRRLREEMGFDCGLHEVTSLVYRAAVSGDLIEHEYDHIYVGIFDGKPEANPEEVSDWQWLGLPQLRACVATRPGDFTVWFRVLLERGQQDGIEQWCALAHTASRQTAGHAAAMANRL